MISYQTLRFLLRCGFAFWEGLSSAPPLTALAILPPLLGARAGSEPGVTRAGGAARTAGVGSSVGGGETTTLWCSRIASAWSHIQ